MNTDDNNYFVNHIDSRITIDKLLATLPEQIVKKARKLAKHATAAKQIASVIKTTFLRVNLFIVCTQIERNGCC